MLRLLLLRLTERVVGTEPGRLMCDAVRLVEVASDGYTC